MSGEEVLDTVRSHFESDEPSFAGGPAFEFATAMKALEFDARKKVTIRALELLSVEDHEARLEVDATERATSADGKRNAAVSLSGPVRARREGDDWKVVDYCVDGRPISDAFAALTSEPVDLSRLRLRLGSVWLDRRWTYAFVEVEQDSERPAKVRQVALKVGRSWCGGRWTPPTLKPTRQQWLLLRWRKTLSLDTSPFRIHVHLRAPEGRHVSVAWLVDHGNRVATGSVERAGRLATVLGSAWAPWATLGVLFAGYVAAYGVPSLFFFVTTAVLFGGYYLYWRWRG